MGTFTHAITLIAPSGETEAVEVLVDTSATFTSVPATVLERLGVRRGRRVRLRLANGQIHECQLGAVMAELDGERETILCIFGESGWPAVIGAHTLEAFLLAADPVEQKLVPVEGWFA